jgi:hypothetical protein
METRQAANCILEYYEIRIGPDSLFLQFIFVSDTSCNISEDGGGYFDE